MSEHAYTARDLRRAAHEAVRAATKYCDACAATADDAPARGRTRLLGWDLTLRAEGAGVRGYGLCPRGHRLVGRALL
jgi:hypothetical protein